MKTFLVIILLIFFMAACHEEKKPIEVPKNAPTMVTSEPNKVAETKKNLTENTDSLLLDQVIPIKTTLSDELRILISTESKYNLLIKIKDDKGYLCGACGLGTSKLVGKKPSEIIERKELIKNEATEFVIQTYVDGSTYGAQNLVIIWYDGIGWNITKDPFQRAFLEDRDNDGILEVVEYFASKNKKGDVYRFKDGCFESW